MVIQTTMVDYEPITKANLERITNGIFAFTMTLLARDIVTPEQYANAQQITVEQFSYNTISSIIDFAGSFLILAMFWMLFFQMFHRMKTYNFHFLHVHMFSLMFIVLIPFSSTFSNLGENDYTFADYFFQVNVFVLGVILVYLWNYARSKPELLNPEVTSADSIFLLYKCCIPPVVGLIGIFWVIASLDYSDFLYFLPFIILGFFFRNPPGESV